MIDAGKEYRVVLDVPGAVKEDLEVVAGPVRGTVAVRAKRRPEKESEGRTLVRERGGTGASEYYRVLPVAWDADVGKAKPTLTDGVLSIAIPKESAPGPASSNTKR